MAPALFRSDAPRRRLAALLLAAAGWSLLPATAHAQGTSGVSATAPATAPASAPQPAASARPTWAELSPVNQRILAPLQPLWDTLPELNRHKWLRIAERYPKFSPAEQARLQARMAEWVKMTPQQRRLARENYQITRSLPAEKKAEAWDKYQQLPEEQKKKLAAAERVPHRPGAVSALPSGKRLPSDTSKLLRHEPRSASAVAHAGVHARARAASEAQAASAPAVAAAVSAPAAVPAPPASAAPASPAGPASDSITEAAASETTARQ
ncbi:DUF3106 domain-containing protein [Cupriavidus necator]|uniref:DUF3106 domain-containing protein n=1 Tax=Cupriavidus necator TaxID=106590 RepID=UPI00339D7948